MNKDSMGKLIERAATMKNLQEKQITQAAASIQLGVSERQIRRLYKRYKENGSEALIHKNIGKESKRRLPLNIETQAIEWLTQNGPDFGSTFSQEKLIEYLGINVSVSTIRTWRIRHKLHVSRSKKCKIYVRRQRKQFFGAMLQLDGSIHDWFEGRGTKCMLLTMIDDATGKIHAIFSKGESTEGLMTLLRQYIEMYGRPHVIYTDHGGAYKVNIGNADGTKKTQLGRALDELGIKLIYANSPQAKGRVERNHGIHQDRLVKEMRLKKISSIDEANRYLQKVYIPQFNKQFGVAPVRTQDVHRSIKGFNLDNIFCIQETRIIQNDGVVQFNKLLLQITKNRIYAKAKNTVLIRSYFDGTIKLSIGSIQLEYECINNRPIKIIQEKQQPIRKPVNNASKAWSEGSYLPYKLKYNYSSAYNTKEGRVE